MNHPLAVEFAPRADLGIPYPSAIVLLSPDEWASVQEGRLALPDGWSTDRLQAI